MSPFTVSPFTVSPSSIFNINKAYAAKNWLVILSTEAYSGDKEEDCAVAASADKPGAITRSTSRANHIVIPIFVELSYSEDDICMSQRRVRQVQY